MHRHILLSILSIALQAQDTPPGEFVSEWIRELSAFRSIQVSAAKEMAGSDNKLMDVIRSSSRTKLELQTSIKMLKGMKLTRKPYDALIPAIITFYEQKYSFNSEVIELSKQFLVDAPKPGIDYTKLAARMPEINASLEYIDKALFECTPLIFAVLIDERADSQGHANHLVISKAQQETLINRIKANFGDALTEKNQSYTVASASVLLTYFTKGYKCSDEPW